MNTGFLGPAVATVLTACGIETCSTLHLVEKRVDVATVLTACGIETAIVVLYRNVPSCCNSTYRLRY